MSTIRVEVAGLLTTVQDLGRPGFGAIGVSASGAADPISLRLGNRLAGNLEGVAALEMTIVGGSLYFPEGAIVALTGSDFAASVDGSPLESWRATRIRGKQTIQIGATRSGARCYLCVRGGIIVRQFLESASTHLLSGLGGFEGRALRKGDVLQIGAATASFREAKIDPQVHEALMRREILRVTPGPQADSFSRAALNAFYASAWRVGEQSNRMGLRLEGSKVEHSYARSMITEGVSLGSIQITPDGTPIILFVDQQTTGGYPKIANVVSADMHRVGQLRPRDQIRFEPVTFEIARALLAEQEKVLASEEIILR